MHSRFLVRSDRYRRPMISTGVQSLSSTDLHTISAIQLLHVAENAENNSPSPFSVIRSKESERQGRDWLSCVETEICSLCNKTLERSPRIDFRRFLVQDATQNGQNWICFALKVGFYLLCLLRFCTTLPVL